MFYLQLTPIGTTIFQGIQAKDADAGVNGLVEYFIVPGDGSRLGTDDGVGHNRVTVADGAEFFSINLPHQGQITVNKSLDYERTQRYLITVVASVSHYFLILTRTTGKLISHDIFLSVLFVLFKTEC